MSLRFLILCLYRNKRSAWAMIYSTTGMVMTCGGNLFSLSILILAFPL